MKDESKNNQNKKTTQNKSSSSKNKINNTKKNQTKKASTTKSGANTKARTTTKTNTNKSSKSVANKNKTTTGTKKTTAKKATTNTKNINSNKKPNTVKKESSVKEIQPQKAIEKEVQSDEFYDIFEEEKKLKQIRKSKKYSVLYFYSFMILYLEILTKVLVTKSTTGIIYTLLFSASVIILLGLLSNIFKKRVNKVITYIFTIIFSCYYAFHFFFNKLFSNIFSFNTIGMAGNVVEFKNILFETLSKNVIFIILYLLPIILLVIFRKKINFESISWKNILIKIMVLLGIFMLSLASLFINRNEMYSAYNLYYNVNNEFKMVEKFGLATYTRLDIKRVLFGFDEEITLHPSNNKVEEEPTISYNKIDINFDELINNESNNTIKSVLSYFKNSEASKKNEYTGMFKDKNLIFILAESFNTIAVDPELTPTLYKLTHEGFVFNNFYSPVFLSTTGGEFQATTGLIPTQEVLSTWKKNLPTLTYSFGNAFKSLGYNVRSYHNWEYDYYERDKTMSTEGFDYFSACGNGLEKIVNCKWIPSDIEMFKKTLPEYKNDEHFVTYYITMSGHGPYHFGSSSPIAKKNKKLVEKLPYSDSVKAYLATQIEFDRALKSLIDGLREEGILDDTVISFVGDHYPYTLSLDEINEISDFKRDAVVGVNKSNLVIWNSAMEDTILVEKVGSEIDILPTLLNLFGIDYDSRLIMGNDILSDTPGLAIFSNRSWVSDYGVYNTGKFTINKGATLDNEEEYIESINKIVANRFTVSSQIIKYNMYDYILK